MKKYLTRNFLYVKCYGDMAGTITGTRFYSIHSKVRRNQMCFKDAKFFHWLLWCISGHASKPKIFVACRAFGQSYILNVIVMCKKGS